MLHSTYMRTRPIVMALAQEKNTSSAPQISTHTNARTCTPTCRLIALTGVFLVGFTFPTIFGSTPDRPIAYQVRVPPLKHAMDRAMAEFSNAKTTVSTTTEPTSPMGTLRFGFLLSSASGPVDSHPLKAKIENTTPRNKLPARPKLPGLSGPKLKPPGPGDP